MDAQKKREGRKNPVTDTWFWRYVVDNRFVSILIILLLLFTTLYAFSQIAYLFEPLQLAFSIIGPPILLALLMYYLLNPLVNWLEEKGVGRNWGIALVFSGILCIIALAVMFIIPGLRDQVNELIDNFPRIWATVLLRVEELLYTDWLTELYREIQATNILERISEQISNLFTVTIDSLGSIIESITKVTITLVTTPFVLYYFLADGQRFKQTILKVTPTRARPTIQKFMTRANEQVGSYVRGQLLVALFVAIVFYIGYTIIDLDYALILSIAAGLLNLIPYVGSIIAAVPALIIGAFISPAKFVQVIIVILVEQTAESRLISPLILGNELDIHPLIILFILLVSGSLFGLAGLILAVPGFAVLRIIWELFFEWIQENYDYYDDEETTLE